MTIGLAILVATILILIDRNRAWPRVWAISKRLLKIGAILLLLTGVGVGVWAIIDQRQNLEKRRAQASNEAQQAEAQKAQQLEAQKQQAEAQEQKRKDQQSQAEWEARHEAEIDAKREARKSEHTRRIGLIKLAFTNLENPNLEPPSQSLPGDHPLHSIGLRVTNNTPETISSITLSIFKNEGEQPTYLKISVNIEPGKHVNVASTSDAQCTKLGTNYYQCNVINLSPGDGTVVSVKDFTGNWVVD